MMSIWKEYFMTGNSKKKLLKKKKGGGMGKLMDPEWKMH